MLDSVNAALDSSTVVFTDGSRTTLPSCTSGPDEDDAAGAGGAGIILSHDSSCDKQTATFCHPTTAITSCEGLAICEAIDEVLAHEQLRSKPVLFVVDCLSLLLLVRNGPAAAKCVISTQFWTKVLALAVHTTIKFYFVYSHIDIVHDLQYLLDEVDTLAQRAARAPGRPFKRVRTIATDIARTAARAKRTATSAATLEGTIRSAHPCPTFWSAFEPLTLQRAILAQARTGVSAALGGHLFGFDSPCKHCPARFTRGDAAMVKHVFECPTEDAADARGDLTINHLFGSRSDEAAAYLEWFLETGDVDIADQDITDLTVHEVDTDDE